MPDIRGALKIIFEEKAYKQTVIAEKAGLTPAKLSGILNKKRKLDADELFVLCDVLGISPNELLKNKQESA